MSGRDDRPTREGWRKLKAEWMHDYGLRRMEDRGVKYEDEAGRELDHAAARGKGGEQDVPLAGRAAKPAAQPRHPWPSEVAERNRNQPGQDLGKTDGQEHSHDDGHSM
jgi:hypothetical protein